MRCLALVCEDPVGWVDHLAGVADGHGFAVAVVTAHPGRVTRPDVVTVAVDSVADSVSIVRGLLLLRRQGFDLAGCTTCDDQAVLATAEAAAALSLPHPALSGLMITRDKYATRQVVPWGPRVATLVRDHDDLRAAFDLVPPPVIVKPRFGRASDHVRRLEHPDDIDPGFLAGRSEWVVESVILGQEFSADLVVRGGSVLVAGVLEKFIVSSDRFREEGFRTTPIEDAENLAPFFQEIVTRAGIDDCLVHVEFKLAPEPTVVEINSGRMGGLLVAPLIHRHTGVDLGEEQLAFALGGTPRPHEAPALRPPLAGLITFLDVPGEISRVADPTELQMLPSVVSAFPMCRVGQQVASVEAECPAYGAVVVGTEDTDELIAIHAELQDFTRTGVHLRTPHGAPLVPAR